MKKYIIILLTLSIGTIMAQKDSSSEPTLEFGKHKRFVLSVESNLLKVTSNLNFRGVGINGGISFDYYVAKRLYTGIFYNTMTDISNSKSLYVIDEKVIDLSTSTFSNYGVEMGYRLLNDGKINIIPELRFGYGQYRANSANFGINNNKNTLNIYMLTLCPKVNFAYSLTNWFDIGMSGGYLIPIYTSRSSFKEYDLQNINVGLFLKTYF